MLVKLAKIYDMDATRKTITIYKIIDTVKSVKQFNKDDKKIIAYVDDKLKQLSSDKYKNAQNNLKLMRDKYLVHYDKNYYDGLKSIYARDKIKYNELEELIDFSYVTIKKIYEICFNESLTDIDISILKEQNKTIKNKIKERF